MESISLPTTVAYVPGDQPNKGRLVVEPLYPGYGTTVGNALRRVLLSSLPGAAVTAIKISGAPHEFTALPKIQEDILQIIMNVKQLRLRVFSDEPVRLLLSAKGEKVATAKDIQPNSDVEVANPDLPIATLTSKDASFEVELWVRQGRGYHTTEARIDEARETGVIAIDSFFSPVRRVSFDVERARVGQMTNFDKLVMDIETDETITGEDAVRQATAILVEQFRAIGELGAPSAPVTGAAPKDAEPETEAAVVEASEPVVDAASSEDDNPTPKPKRERSAKKK